MRFAGGGDNTHLLSAGDDAIVRHWDITLGEEASSYAGHTDYCRAVSCSRSDPNVFLTGGYDHRCLLWDARQRDPVRSWVHAPDAPVVSFRTASPYATFAASPSALSAAS